MSLLADRESTEDLAPGSPPVPGAASGYLSAIAFLGLFVFGILLNSVFAKGLYPMPTVPAAETVQ